MPQSLLAQLLRWLALLSLSLVVLHHSPAMVQLLAGRATDGGCHQGGVMPADAEHSNHHGHHGHH